MSFLDNTEEKCPFCGSNNISDRGIMGLFCNDCQCFMAAITDDFGPENIHETLFSVFGE